MAEPSPPDSEKMDSEPITTKDVVFTEATPDQRILSWTLNGASWAPPMTIEQYIGRETALSQTALSGNGGTTYFILHPKNDPETIVSACEVTKKRALVTDSTGENGGVREVTAYSIASVFTNPRFRERGMAGHMLRKVQEFVDSDSAAEGIKGLGAEFGALYSDIGRVYYTRLGWRDFRSPQALMHITADEGNDAGFKVPEGLILLKEEGVLKLCEKDVELVREEFNNIAIGKDGKTHMAFLPTPEQMAWHFTRDKYVCQTLLGREVVYRGARTQDGTSWICWDHDLREKKLKVLRLVVNEDASEEKRRADIQGLLLAALTEAKDWALPKVLLWEPSIEAAAVATGLWRELGPALQVVFEEREDGSIPSLRWKEGKSLEEVVWEDNEYYAWC